MGGRGGCGEGSASVVLEVGEGSASVLLAIDGEVAVAGVSVLPSVTP